MRRNLMSKTDVLDLLGVTLLAGFAFVCWPPLPLLVVGVAALVASWKASRS
jgi:hypothetical protein